MCVNAFRQAAAADLALDGDAGVVAHLLAHTRERIEDGGLATVGVAGEGNRERACGERQRGITSFAADGHWYLTRSSHGSL